MPTPREEMRIVAERLKPLNVPFAFVGGAVMCLLVDHPEVTQFRRAKDVDVIVAVTTYSQFAQLEERLRQNGFKHDMSEGAPICRWIVEACRVDIMPAEPANLGMNTRWFPEVLKLAISNSRLSPSAPENLSRSIENFQTGAVEGDRDLRSGTPVLLVIELPKLDFSPVARFDSRNFFLASQ